MLNNSGFINYFYLVLRNFEQTFLLVFIRSGSLAKGVQKYLDLYMISRLMWRQSTIITGSFTTFRNWSRKTICFYLVLMEDLFQKFSSPQSAFGLRNVNYTPIDKFFLFVFHTYGQSREQFVIKYLDAKPRLKYHDLQQANKYYEL